MVRSIHVIARETGGWAPLLLVGMMGALVASAAAEKPAAAPFAGQPTGSLIRRLDIDATVPAPDESQKVRHRRSQPRGMMAVDITLSNTGQTHTSLDGAILGRWVFDTPGAAAGKYRPLTYRNDTWYGSTYWAGLDWTRVGKDWHHPGTNTPAVRCFRAPAAGRVTVTGRVYKADTNRGGGDGVRLSIKHNAAIVWQAEIAGNDSKGVEPKVALTVAKGDAIRFVVHKRGGIPYDTTRWDPIITYAGGQAHQASKGFSTRRQGESSWWYEMHADANSKKGLPRVHAFGSDLAPVDRTLTVGGGVTLTAGQHLPAFVLADGADQSGVIFAVSPKSPWRFDAAVSKSGQLGVTLSVSGVKRKLNAGESFDGPRVLLAPYTGKWTAGIRLLEQLLAAKSSDPTLRAAGQSFIDAHRRLAGPSQTPSGRPELQLWTMIQQDWQQQDRPDGSPQKFATLLKKHLAATGVLLKDLRQGQPDEFLATEAARLRELTERSAQDTSPAELYHRVRWLKRRIALANPLMNFDQLLFCKRVPTSYSHLVMQYFGWRARPGGGLFVLRNPGRSLAVRDILDGALAGGNVLAPRLDYDARRIVFSFIACNGKSPIGPQHDAEAAGRYYNVYKVDVDASKVFGAGASGLRRLTGGPYEHLMPTCLPDGGIAFSSTRRRGYARCFGGQFGTKWHVYTLHRMDADGKNITTLSFHDTNEWFPSVANDGRILYSRWDYIDRDAVTHQNLWSMRPDGTNPAAVWGNATPSPHCTFQIQPVPNSRKIAFTASAHHSITGGSIALVDPTLGRDGQQAITRITPQVPFPEAEGRRITEYFDSPWPLSEKYFLVAYSGVPLVWEPGANPPNALGLYLIDAFGNRELIYRDPEISSTNPCPLLPRKRPQVVTGNLPDNPPPTGEVMMRDVYRGLDGIKRGTAKELRIVQIFPKTTNLADRPAVGLAREENARAILGAVPIEPDGSARFIMPARTPVLFQVLDADGLAVQTMRSITYLQPGESVSCVGCHEPVASTPPTGRTIAMKRPASRIKVAAFEGEPFSFMRVVQPVLDKHCAKCHTGKERKKKLDLSPTPHRGFTKSYWSLCGDRNFWGGGTNPKNAAAALVPRFGGRNVIQITPPGGMYGSPGSRLLKMLRSPKGHNKVKLSGDDIRRIAAWIDCNAIFYGVNDPKAQARQLKGLKVPMPEVQ